MTVSISSLLTPLVPQDVLDDLYDLLGGIFGQPLALQPGEPIPAVLDISVTWVVNSVWNPVILPALQAQFGDYATGDWLTLFVRYMFNRPRIEQQAGTMQVTLQNRGSFSGNLPVVRCKSSVTGATYTIPAGSGYLAAWTGSPAPYPTVIVTAIADVAGSGSNAQSGDVAQYPTPLIAGPVNVFPSANTQCLGSDEEQDPNLLSRGRAAVGELASAGPLKAYQSVALDPTGAFTRRLLSPPWALTYVPAVTRVRPVPTSYATLTIYLASGSGPATGSTSDVGTDVFNVALALQLFVVPPGTTATVLPATTATGVASSTGTVNLGTITLSVDAASNVTAAEAVATAWAALNAFISALPIGGARIIAGGTGYLFLDKLNAVLTSGPGVVDSSMSNFNADLPMAVGDIVVLNAATSIVANIVNQA